MMMQVTKEFTFDAAHFLPGYEGKCKQLHGHTYSVWVSYGVTLSDEKYIPSPGFMVDFASINDLVKKSVIYCLDHTLLNDLIENPTAENIAIFIASILKDPGNTVQGPFGEKLKLTSIVVRETPTSVATLFL